MLNNILLSGFISSLILCYIPQIYQTYRTKNVSGINKMFWFLLTFGLGCNLVMLVRLNSSWLAVIPQILNFISALIMLVMVELYK